MGEADNNAAPPDAPNIVPVSTDDLAGIWNTFLQLLSAKRVGLPAMLQGATLVGIEDGTAVIRFAHDNETIMRSFERNGKKETIRDVLTAMLKRSIGVRFELDAAPPAEEAEQPAAAPPLLAPTVRRSPPPPPATPAATPPAADQRLTPELKQSLAADPLVAAVIQHLGGEIVKVE